VRRRRPDPDRGPLHRPAPLGTFRIPLHQTDAITADTTSGPPAARTSSACRRAFEGQPLDGNPRLGDWRSATKWYPSGQGRNSVSDLSSELRCRRTQFGTSLKLRSGQPVFAVHAGGYGTLRLLGVADGGQPGRHFDAETIGDAAFALRPPIGVGTEKAADDAWQLGTALLGATARCVPDRLRAWEIQQLPMARPALQRARAAGRSLQEGTWQVGEPPPFGLQVPGDSVLHVAL
jgi:hypothetical protein